MFGRTILVYFFVIWLGLALIHDDRANVRVSFTATAFFRSQKVFLANLAINPFLHVSVKNWD